MANYNTLFSFAITELTDDERAWLDEITGDEHKLAVLVGVDAEMESVGFSAELQDDNSLWVYADESGTPEHVETFVTAFLEKFRPDGSIGFEWANTCSRPVLDAFGGGAVHITATETRWMGSGHWLAMQPEPLLHVRCWVPDYAENDPEYSPWVIAHQYAALLSDDVLGALAEEYTASPAPDFTDGFYEFLGSEGYTLFQMTDSPFELETPA